jgi:hypothetical protein
MEISSFAIWHKNKVIMAISATIWLANAGFQFSGEFTSSIPCESQRIDLTSGVVRVNDLFQFLVFLPYSSTGSRCMDACRKSMLNYQSSARQRPFRRHVGHRHFSTTHHARWLDSPSPS